MGNKHSQTAKSKGNKSWKFGRRKVGTQKSQNQENIIKTVIDNWFRSKTNKYMLPLEINNLIILFVGTNKLSLILSNVLNETISQNGDKFYYAQLLINHLEANKINDAYQLTVFCTKLKHNNFDNDLMNSTLLNELNVISITTMDEIKLYIQVHFYKYLYSASIQGSVVGKYESHMYDNTRHKNNWHYVEITLDTSNDNAVIWSNRANVSWHLYKTDDMLKFKVGQDCPYYSSNWRTMRFIMDDHKTKIVALTGPDQNTEIYEKYINDSLSFQ